MFKLKFAALTTRIGTTTTFAMALTSVLLLSGTALSPAYAQSSLVWYVMCANRDQCNVSSFISDGYQRHYGPTTQEDAFRWLYRWCSPTNHNTYYC
jgi:hypothetical protein